MGSSASRDRSATGGVAAGLRAFLGGIDFVATTPGVWGYALVPVGVFFVLGTCFGLVGIWAAIMAGTAFVGGPTGAMGAAGRWLLTICFSLVGLLVALFVSLGLAQPLSGFALNAIVRAQERALACDSWVQTTSFTTALFRTLRVSVFTAVFGIATIGLFFFTTLVFPPAVVVTTPLSFLVGGWTLAWNFLDYPLGARGLGVRARLKWFSRRSQAILAFGLAWAAVLLIPGVALLLLPMGVAGATRLVIDEEQRR
jgi:CysZ protein